MFTSTNKDVGNKNFCSLPKIAVFSNTFGPKDAMGKHLHLIKKIFPQAEIFLERSNEDPSIPSQTYYFIKHYPHLALYMLEWKLGCRFALLEWLLRPLAKISFWLEAKKFSRYDIIWAQWGLYYNAIHLLPALLAIRKKNNATRPKIIFDYHGITPPEQIVSRGKKLIAEKTIAVTHEGTDCADLCLVRSHFMAQELLRYGKPKKIIYNPLPFLSQNLSTCVQDLRAEHQLAKAKILLYVGRISEHKNLSLVLNALAKLARQDLFFVVVGNDQHRSLAEEKIRLLNLARKLRIPHRIIFTGAVSEDELVCWYKAADAFVMPSLHEGFCWPLVDAMSYGVPILATREGAIPETVGEAALFFDAKDSDDLAAKLTQILDNQELRSQLARQGKEKVKEYSWEKYRETLVEAVQEK